MLMLEDLKKRTNLIQGLINVLHDDCYQVMMSDGKSYLTKPISIKDAKHYQILFDNVDMAFAGVNHNNIIGPLFALDSEINDNVAILKEYLTAVGFDKKVNYKLIEDELTKLAVVILFFYPHIQKIKLPNDVKEFTNEECNITRSFNNCFLNILKK